MFCCDKCTTKAEPWSSECHNKKAKNLTGELDEKQSEAKLVGTMKGKTEV